MSAVGEVGGNIADVAKSQKFKLPFVHIEYAVAFDYPDRTVKFGFYDNVDEARKLMSAFERESPKKNLRVLQRHYSDWTEVE